jgi:hypothetical protein
MGQQGSRQRRDPGCGKSDDAAAVKGGSGRGSGSGRSDDVEEDPGEAKKRRGRPRKQDQQRELEQRRDQQRELEQRRDQQQRTQELAEQRFGAAAGFVERLSTSSFSTSAAAQTSTALATTTIAGASTDEVGAFISNYLARKEAALVKDELIAVAVALDPSLAIPDVATLPIPKLNKLIRSTLVTHHIARARHVSGSPTAASSPQQQQSPVPSAPLPEPKASEGQRERGGAVAILKTPDIDNP